MVATARALTWRVESGEVSLAVHESGPSDGPVVLCLHGLTGTHEYVLMRSRILERAGYRVVSYDARGHGASSPSPDGEYSYAALMDDLETVVDALGAERVAFVGGSMGAHVALSYAMRQPERVSAIAAITPAYAPYHSFLPEVLARWDELAAALRRDGADGFAEVYGRGSHLPDRLLAHVVPLLRRRLLLHDSFHAVAAAIEAVPRSRPYDRVEDVAAVRQPVLVVGTHDEFDPEHPLAIARHYADSLFDARLALEDEGRVPLPWSGGKLSRLLLDFLGSIPSWAPAAEAAPAA